MPTYVYKCSDCNNKFEVFHKSTNSAEEVKCPDCGSEKSEKMIAAANIGGGSGKADPMPQASPCASGMCGLN
jgi:putative FmdB family regulatory protein